MHLLLQTWICRGQHTGHPGFSCQWEQAFWHCQQHPEGDYHVQHAHDWIYFMYFHMFLRSLQTQLKCLPCSSSSMCVSFPFSLSPFICLLPVAHSRTPSCLKSLKSCRWVRLILCIVRCLNGTTFLSSILYMSIRAAGSMSSAVNSLFLWRLVFNLKTHMSVWCHPCVDSDLFFLFNNVMTFVSLISVKCFFVSTLVSAINDRWRPPTHPPFQLRRLLDRPPSGEGCGCESHLFLLWPCTGELRHHGKR